MILLDVPPLIVARARMAAVISIRLFVVSLSPPPSSFTVPSGKFTILPHPPGPGLPEQAPSEKIRIDDGSIFTVLDMLLANPTIILDGPSQAHSLISNKTTPERKNKGCMTWLVKDIHRCLFIQKSKRFFQSACHRTYVVRLPLFEWL